MTRFDYLKSDLAALEDQSRLRQLRTLCNGSNAIVQLDNNGRTAVNFSSNNYLSIANHKHIKEAVCTAVNQSGYGSGGSRLISGTSDMHVQVEDVFARLLGKEAALLFSSGWAANQALLQTLPKKGDLVLLDKLDHASIIDGCLGGDAEFRTYRRGNMDRLEKLLSLSGYARKFIVTESIFSMDGDAANLAALVQLKDKYNAYIIVDEAHAIGCTGPGGAGLAAECDLLDKIDVIVAPLGKAIAASGAVVAGPQAVVDYLINTARPFIYSTSCSQVNCAAILAALDIVVKEPNRRSRLADLSAYARGRLQGAGFDTGRSASHIIPVMIGDDESALHRANWLLDRGYFVVAIRPPTVPKGSARLRISLQYDHKESQIDGLVESLRSFTASGQF